jgi:DNA repair protein RecN (Recombination protein N)
MLKFLNIVNFAIISRLRVEFHAGLNLLTGETGAGKSIIVDALSLLLGTRASTEVIRTGERVSFVEGTFELTKEHSLKVQELLSGVGITLEADEDLMIRRELQAGGRSRIFINDRSVSAATLKALQPFLVEIHGQGQQQSLLNARGQLRLLDTFNGCEELLQKVSEAYMRRRGVMESLRSSMSDEIERARTLELIRYQLTELERINPQADEEELLLADKALLAQAERILELNAKAFATLYEQDESVLAQLASIKRWLQDLQAVDARVTAALEAVAAATDTLADVADELRHYRSDLDFSPARLAEIENRLAELERLKRKYGCGLDELQRVRLDLRARVNELENWTERERELRAELSAIEQEYASAAGRLSTCRRTGAPLLAQTVEADLQHVALAGARFIVQVETARADARRGERSWAESDSSANAYWTPSGADRVEFLLTANVGEEARPLSRVASGGELSRLMLTLRAVAQGSSSQAHKRTQGATLVFDEIDVGIGGRVAEAVGRRLKTLAGTQQVLCVTHQPQIARFADHHYLVEKQEEAGRTVTSIREVRDEARVGELARMIGGSEDVATTRETARWLIESAAQAPKLAATSTLRQRVKRGKSRRTDHAD